MKIIALAFPTSFLSEKPDSSDICHKFHETKVKDFVASQQNGCGLAWIEYLDLVPA